MNNSYIGYFKDHFPIKFLNNIFRNYKKSTEQLEICWNSLQSKGKPQEQQTKRSMDGTANIKSEEVADAREEILNVQNCNKKTYEGRPFFNFPKKPYEMSEKHKDLFRKSGEINLSIREKLQKIPVYNVRENSFNLKIEQNKVYPWQNFNVDTLNKPRYRIIKPVNNITREILSMKKPILKKADTFKPVRKKEVKFNTNATFMVFPKGNSNTSLINSQPRINLSTNCQNFKKNTGNSFVKNTMKLKMKQPRNLNQKYLTNKNKVGYYPKLQHRFLYYDKKPKFFS